MSRISEWLSRLTLHTLPGAVLVAGALLISLNSHVVVRSNTNLLISIACVVVAPILATLITVWIRPGIDSMLIASCSLLASIGMSALLGIASRPGDEQAFYLEIVTRHGYFVAAGFLAMVFGVLVAAKIEQIARFPFTLMLVALALTAVTMVIGRTVNGARLWLEFGPVRFQPAEVARLLLATFVAIYLYDRRHLIMTHWRVGRFDLPPAPYLLPVAGAVAVAMLVLVAQNDLGMAALVALGTFASVSFAMQSRTSSGLLGLIVIAAIVFAYQLSPRVQDRVQGWVAPWQDPMIKGFQFVQSDYALAAGGLAGAQDISPGRYVPEVQTDFILVAIGSQFGVLAAVAVLATVAVVLVRCAICSVWAASELESRIALGLTALLASQVVLIVGGVLRVLPLTGLTFPLVSYGGTSMVATLLAIGVIVGIGARGRAAQQQSHSIESN